MGLARIAPAGFEAGYFGIMMDLRTQRNGEAEV
jgi:hypothetical protein